MDRIELEAKSDRELLILSVQNLNALCERVNQQNGRVRRLEDWRNYLTGALALLALLVGVFGSWVLGRLG